MGAVDARVAAVARKQRGLITRWQMRELGIGRSTVHRRCASGAWQVRFGTVIDTRTHAESWAKGLTALVLAAGRDAVVSHDTAAYLHRLPATRRPVTYDVCVLRHEHAEVAGTRLHTTVRLPSIEVAHVEGLRVTSVARTIVDQARTASDLWLQRAIGDALRRGAFRLDELVAAAFARPGLGVAARVLRLIEGLPPGLARSDSSLEVVGLLWLARVGLVPDVVQHTVELSGGTRVRFDAAWPDRLVALEFDGERWHAGSVAARLDAARQALAEADGWRIIRCGESEIVAGAASSPTLDHLRDALRPPRSGSGTLRSQRATLGR